MVNGETTLKPGIFHPRIEYHEIFSASLILPGSSMEITITPRGGGGADVPET